MSNPTDRTALREKLLLMTTQLERMTAEWQKRVYAATESPPLPVEGTAPKTVMVEGPRWWQLLEAEALIRQYQKARSRGRDALGRWHDSDRVRAAEDALDKWQR
jgi:hypothetical protein